MIRARAIKDGKLVGGRVDLNVTADTLTNTSIDLKPVSALRVRVVNEWNDPVAGAEVAAEGCGTLKGQSGPDGKLELTPPSLCEYAPPYQLQLQGTWRNVRPQQARLGDDLVDLVARQFNAALDSTDAGPAVPSGP
jgi:hypothetical protein